MTEVAESGHHDLCFLGEPCSEQVAEHGFCSRQSTICIHCERECICERLKQAGNYARIAAMHTVDVDSYEQGQRDALREAREVIALLEIMPCGCTCGAEFLARPEALAAIDAAIDALKEKP